MAYLTEIVAVEVSDEPGGLARVLEILHTNGINVEYMYGFLEKFSDKALLVFRFDNSDKAIEVLKNSSIKIISATDINAL
jgi:hypothetical protein